MTDLGIPTSNSGGALTVRVTCTISWDRGGGDTSFRGNNNRYNYDDYHHHGDGGRKAIGLAEHDECLRLNYLLVEDVMNCFITTLCLVV